MRSFNMTVDLSPEEIKEAISEFVNQNLGNGENGMYVSATDVSLDVGMEYEDRPGGSSFPKLKGASVKVKKMGPYQDR